MNDQLEPRPTQLERLGATVALCLALATGLSALALLMWWLYEAATRHAVRGHRGAWVALADSPSAFWPNVGLIAFWASLLLVCMTWVFKRLSTKDRWAATVSRIVRNWRLKR